MTLEQVSALSKVELNRVMAWLYGPTVDHDDGEELTVDDLSDFTPVDYLADWNLTMPLALENGLIIDFPMNFASKWLDDYGEKPMLRNICEVLVLIAMEGK